MDLLHVLFHPRYDLPVGVKVAIIDDGIDLSRVQGCVLTGKSYAGYSSGRPKPFYFSSTGQGTEVASLVSHFYPRLQLCVVRIDPDDASLRTLAQVREDPHRPLCLTHLVRNHGSRLIEVPRRRYNGR